MVLQVQESNALEAMAKIDDMTLDLLDQVINAADYLSSNAADTPMTSDVLKETQDDFENQSQMNSGQFIEKYGQGAHDLVNTNGDGVVSYSEIEAADTEAVKTKIANGKGYIRAYGKNLVLNGTGAVAGIEKLKDGFSTEVSNISNTVMAKKELKTIVERKMS